MSTRTKSTVIDVCDECYNTNEEICKHCNGDPPEDVFYGFADQDTEEK